MPQIQQGNSIDKDRIDIIVFRIQGKRFFLNATIVREVHGWPSGFVCNVFCDVLCVVAVSGLVIPVVNLALMLGYTPITPNESSPIIVVWIYGRLVGLLVDEITGLTTVGRREFTVAGELVTPTFDGSSLRPFTDSPEIMTYLDVADMFRDEHQNEWSVQTGPGL